MKTNNHIAIHAKLAREIYERRTKGMIMPKQAHYEDIRKHLAAALASDDLASIESVAARIVLAQTRLFGVEERKDHEELCREFKAAYESMLERV